MQQLGKEFDYTKAKLLTNSIRVYQHLAVDCHMKLLQSEPDVLISEISLGLYCLT